MAARDNKNRFDLTEGCFVVFRESEVVVDDDRRVVAFVNSDFEGIK